MKDESNVSAGIERRPIAARRVGIFRSIASGLAARGVAPNAISMAGMVCAAGAAVLLCLAQDSAPFDRWCAFGAAALIQLRLLANLLDGMVAVEGGLRSPTGELFNEVPDRISDVLILLAAGYAMQSSPLLGWIASLLAVFVAYVRVFGRSMDLPGDYRGPMAKQQRMFLITVACLLIALLPNAWLMKLVWSSASGDRGPLWFALALIIVGCIVTVIRRLVRIMQALNARGDGG